MGPSAHNGSVRRTGWCGSIDHFDRRGTGASDPLPPTALPTWENWTEDVTAVLDAVHSEKAAVFAEGDAGPIGVLFAAHLRDAFG
jgi:pimeloyl-ACP methyl ester carboxylesterase